MGNFETVGDKLSALSRDMLKKAYALVAQQEPDQAEKTKMAVSVCRNQQQEMLHRLDLLAQRDGVPRLIAFFRKSNEAGDKILALSIELQKDSQKLIEQHRGMKR